MEAIYKDIAERTQGDIYIGVVGPVRTGKSTFVKKFMDLLVLPNIEGDYQRERAHDELPQSAAGRTIMTTEPKFIPNEAVSISLADNAKMNVRMIDCVGYIVDGALGGTEDGMPRMVKTPWFDEEIPFGQAAEIGTQKVIREHSTIGLVVITDGSITEIPRENYIEAEERVIKELKEINKPFLIVLNSTNPSGPSCQKLRMELEEKYNVPVVAIDCANMSAADINGIIENVLFEFPIVEIAVEIPSWVEGLDDGHYVKAGFYKSVRESLGGIEKIRHINTMTSKIEEFEYAERVKVENINLGSGHVNIEITAAAGLFYKVLSEFTGFEINNEGTLMSLIRDLAVAKKNYDKFEDALQSVAETGYGVVSPSIDELTLEEPEIVKQGGRFGVRLRASAPSIHMIRADIETEVSPIVGSEKQSEDLVRYLLGEFETDPKKIWESNLFGKSLHELVNEDLNNKLCRMPEDAQIKLRETLQKIINEGSGGLICIIL